MRKTVINFVYVKAKYGRKRIHIKYPYVANDVTLCRFAQYFVPAKKEDGIMCQFCQKRKNELSPFWEWKEIIG